MTTVRTQAELDAALARGDERIDIRSKEGKAPRVVVACREVDIDGAEAAR